MREKYSHIQDTCQTDETLKQFVLILLLNTYRFTRLKYGIFMKHSVTKQDEALLVKMKISFDFKTVILSGAESLPEPLTEIKPKTSHSKMCFYYMDGVRTL